MTTIDHWGRDLVIIPGEDEDFCEVAAAFIDNVLCGQSGVQPADERHRDLTRVVRPFGADDETI